MKYQALTLKAPGIARSIVIPVVAGQSKVLCQKFGLERIEADVLALIDTGATDTSISDRLAASLGLEVVAQCRVDAAGGNSSGKRVFNRCTAPKHGQLHAYSGSGVCQNYSNIRCCYRNGHTYAG
ncbi:MAG: retropepsin-like domain-containing protein [Spirochaetaceae bacterium]|nr:retropepsin-like domain-containing protein [Spirochaetaceae bacterium]